MNKEKRILIVAQKKIQLFCAGLTALLQREANFHAEIFSGGLSELRTVVSEFNPDVILHIPNSSAPTSSLRTINRHRKYTKLLLILEPDTKWTLHHLLDLGADGAISSEASSAELLQAIGTIVVKNLKYISPLLIDTLAEPTKHGLWSSLSNQEVDIALFIANGKRNFEIAAEMSISPKTVSTYKTRIYQKLGVSSAVQLLILWQQQVARSEVAGGTLTQLIS